MGSTLASPRARPGGGRRRLLMVAAIAVVAVLIVASLFVWGPLKIGGSNSGGARSAAPLNFSTAYSAAYGAVNRSGGGPWRLQVAEGQALPAAETMTANQSGVYHNFPACSSVHIYVSNGTKISIAAYSGTPTSGDASAWAFYFVNSTGYFEVLDNGGATAPIVSADCPGENNAPPLPLPADVSSANAAVSAWDAGGSSFSTNHSSTGFSFLFSPGHRAGRLVAGSDWSVRYYECGPEDLTTNVVVPEEAEFVNGTTYAPIPSESGAATGQCDGLDGLGALGSLEIEESSVSAALVDRTSFVYTAAQSSLAVGIGGANVTSFEVPSNASPNSTVSCNALLAEIARVCLSVFLVPLVCPGCSVLATVFTPAQWQSFRSAGSGEAVACMGPGPQYASAQSPNLPTACASSDRNITPSAPGDYFAANLTGYPGESLDLVLWATGSGATVTGSAELEWET